MDEWINTTEHDGEERSADDCWFAPPGISGECTDSRTKWRAERHDERVAEGCDDAQPFLNEEGGQPGHETEDQSVHHDQSSGADDHSRKQRGTEKGTEIGRRMSG